MTEIVTAHAIIRYLERKWSIDVDAIRKEMIAEGLAHVRNDDGRFICELERRGFDCGVFRREIYAICRAAVAAGAMYLRRDGLTFVFDGGYVVTVYCGVTKVRRMGKVRKGNDYARSHVRDDAG